MCNGDFFVMLTTQNGGCTPLMKSPRSEGDEAEFITFETETAAKKAASKTVLGEMFGFEVFERGLGV